MILGAYYGANHMARRSWSTMSSGSAIARECLSRVRQAIKNGEIRTEVQKVRDEMLINVLWVLCKQHIGPHQMNLVDSDFLVQQYSEGGVSYPWTFHALLLSIWRIPFLFPPYTMPTLFHTFIDLNTLVRYASVHQPSKPPSLDSAKPVGLFRSS